MAAAVIPVSIFGGMNGFSRRAKNGEGMVVIEGRGDDGQEQW
jgi:hypothetical protein